MKGAFKNTVSPRVVAVVILVTLGAVQWWWWQGLVAKHSSRSGPGSAPQGSASRPMQLYIPGREDVEVETIAGATEPGFSDGPGYAARFDGPGEIILEKSGDLLAADTRNHRIRRISADGLTTTAAGGDMGFRDGPAAIAQFSSPCGIRAQPDGSSLILDAGNRRIRRLASGGVTTVASFPTLADAWREFDQRGGPLTARVVSPEASPGSEDMGLNALRVSSPLSGGQAAFDDQHSALFLIRNGSADVIAGTYSPKLRMQGWLDGSGDKSRFGRVGGIATLNDRTVYVSDTSNNCIRRVTIPEGG